MKKNISLIVFFCTFLLSPQKIYAQALQRCDADRISTAIGCVPITTRESFAVFFLQWVVGLSGGIAFLFIIFSAIKIMTAQGDPQKLSDGRELLTAAVSGLILIVLSVFLLNLVGYNILRLPEF